MRIKTIVTLLGSLFFGAKLPAQTLIIPQPQEVRVGIDTFWVSAQTKIVCTAQSKSVAIQLQHFLQQGLDSPMQVIEAKKAHAGNISFIHNKKLGKEAYELDVSHKGIKITATHSAGWFYALQSLKQWFPPHFGHSKRLPAAVPLRSVKIKDAPRFSWRAFMLDEARHFKGMEQVKMLLDEMAYLKMNVFHWHLVDDQGWRIEIKKYPLLTDIGSKRKSTQLGQWESPIQSAETHEGFYTQREIAEVIAYASARQITIVPEIEMPGHSSAAIAAYPWLGANKDTTEVPITFGKKRAVYDVADPRVYQFLTDVLDEVSQLFPSKVIHIGGDEVKYMQWKQSPSIKAYMKERGLKTPAELQIYFTNRISQYLAGKGRSMMGWNEILGHQVHDYQQPADTESDQTLAQSSIIHFWKGAPELATQAASQGYRIVNALHSSTYLDYDYKTLPLRKAYHFDPIPKQLAPEHQDMVIGTSCQMWGEWIPTNGQMHFQVFPRIAAYAEVGWTKPSKKDFEHFMRALKNLQTRWELLGIYYYDPNE